MTSYVLLLTLGTSLIMAKVSKDSLMVSVVDVWILTTKILISRPTILVLATQWVISHTGSMPCDSAGPWCQIPNLQGKQSY